MRAKFTRWTEWLRSHWRAFLLTGMFALPTSLIVLTMYTLGGEWLAGMVIGFFILGTSYLFTTSHAMVYRPNYWLPISGFDRDQYREYCRENEMPCIIGGTFEVIARTSSVYEAVELISQPHASLFIGFTHRNDFVKAQLALR